MKTIRVMIAVGISALFLGACAVDATGGGSHDPEPAPTGTEVKTPSTGTITPERIKLECWVECGELDTDVACQNENHWGYKKAGGTCI
jgi:hypothetical protein